MKTTLSILTIGVMGALLIGGVMACSSGDSGDDPSPPTADGGAGTDAAPEAETSKDADSGTLSKDSGGDAATDAGGSASNTIVGTIAGKTPGAKDAIAFNKQSRLTIKITDYVGACALEANNNAHKQNSGYLELYLNPYPGVTATLGVGAVAQASYFTRDAACGGASRSATGGSITVAAVTSTGVRGTFALSFGADQLTGSFDAPVCGGGVLVGSGGPCVP